MEIDLFLIPSKYIYDLTSRKAQDEWSLSNPKKDITRQALEDAIRTQEILIKCTIPGKAIRKL